MSKTVHDVGKRFLYAILTILFGAFAGAFAWMFFFLMNAGIDLLWNQIPALLSDAGFPAVFYPIAFCTLGGLIIGLFTKKFGPYPQDMNQVMGEVKKTGRYEYNHIGASFFGALLPLLFGGSIGPEAGLTGVIAGLCTWVGDRLKFVGASMRELAEAGTAAVISAIFATPLFGLAVPVMGAADGSENPQSVSYIHLDVPKPIKCVVYILAVAGALGAMALLGMLFGASGGLPHLSAMSMGTQELIWCVPLILCGILAGWLYYPFGAAARFVSNKLGDKVILKPVLCGVVLGCIGVFLPYAMFAGEAQTEILIEGWELLPALGLIAMGYFKVFTTQLCLNMGWRGGHFFPVIFAGISIGFGLASLTGIDPVFALCCVTGALMGVIMRQPVMTVLLLFLVFPINGALVLLVAAALGSAIPIPKRWHLKEE